MRVHRHVLRAHFRELPRLHALQLGKELAVHIEKDGVVILLQPEQALVGQQGVGGRTLLRLRGARLQSVNHLVELGACGHQNELQHGKFQQLDTVAAQVCLHAVQQSGHHVQIACAQRVEGDAEIHRLRVLRGGLLGQRRCQAPDIGSKAGADAHIHMVVVDPLAQVAQIDAQRRKE